MRTISMLAALAAMAVPVAANAQGACPAPRFTVSDLKNGDGALDRGWIGGVSLADADADGDLDLYATHGYDTGPTPPKPPHPDRSMLYLNDGEGNFTRAEDSALSNADHYTSGSSWGDMDNDGDLDVFVNTQVGRPDVFYRNLGKGRFAKEPLGAATEVKSSNFTGSWVDIDGDGDLDLHVGGPTLEQGAPTLVYRNDAGSLTPVDVLPAENGKNNPGAVLWADLDNDGDQDLIITNSDIQRQSKMEPAPVEHSVVYRNDGGWKFSTVGGQPFSSMAYSANNAALGDIDGDGLIDLFLGAYATGSEGPVRDWLFRNIGGLKFEEVTSFKPKPHPDMSTGASFLDVDLDGDLDLLTAGSKDSIRLFLNDGTGRLTAVNDPVLSARIKTHGSVATGDIDGDGDADAVISDWGEKAGGEFMTLVRNEGPRCGDWIEIALANRHGAPNPPGARVVLVTRDAAGVERRRLREAAAQTTFRGQSGSPFLFGAPKGERLMRAEVRWPEGATQTITRIKRNGRTTVKQGG